MEMSQAKDKTRFTLTSAHDPSDEQSFVQNVSVRRQDNFHDSWFRRDLVRGRGRARTRAGIRFLHQTLSLPLLPVANRPLNRLMIESRSSPTTSSSSTNTTSTNTTTLAETNNFSGSSSSSSTNTFFNDFDLFASSSTSSDSTTSFSPILTPHVPLLHRNQTFSSSRLSPIDLASQPFSTATSSPTPTTGEAEDESMLFWDSQSSNPAPPSAAHLPNPSTSSDQPEWIDFMSPESTTQSSSSFPIDQNLPGRATRYPRRSSEH